VHQNKIDFALNPSEINFSKLGYLNMNSNEQTNYESREMKTVTVDKFCTHIKLVCQHSFPNDKNMFSQVGIVSISAVGKLMMDALKRPASRSRDSELTPEDREEINGNSRRSSAASSQRNPLDEQLRSLDEHLDPEVKNRLRQLDEARKKAEANEDYTEAKMLYQAYKNIIIVSVQIVKLQERKMVAVQNFDYDNAELLKMVT
jgi:centrosomal protein CEP104